MKQELSLASGLWRSTTLPMTLREGKQIYIRITQETLEMTRYWEKRNDWFQIREMNIHPA